MLIFIAVGALTRSESPTAIGMRLIQMGHKAFASLPSSPIDDLGVLEAGWVQFNQVTTSSEFPMFTDRSEAHQRSGVSCRHLPC